MFTRPGSIRRATFEQIHDRGVAEFGIAWIHANSDAVAFAHEAGMDTRRDDVRRAISLTVLRSMYRGRDWQIKTHGQPKRAKAQPED